jgi:AraC-like DNA-binding protein
MIDPLAEIVTLLQPVAGLSKVISGAGPWRLRRVEIGQPSYCVILEGACELTVNSDQPLMLQKGDFILIPAAHSFTMSSLLLATPENWVETPTALPDGGFRLGQQSGTPDFLLLVGHFEFGSPDTSLLVSLLPRCVHTRGEKRLSDLVRLVIDESRANRPARDVILSRLLEVLLIEALRTKPRTFASQGLLRGLADERIAAAIRLMHKDLQTPWTISQLARAVGLSRSAFFEKFNRTIGLSPMEYFLAWRMILAKNLLLRKDATIADVARRIGYSSASAFSVAFSRHVGLPPSAYAREQIETQNLADYQSISEVSH